MLIAAAEQALRDAGHESAYLWVLAGNERAAARADPDQAISSAAGESSEDPPVLGLIA